MALLPTFNAKAMPVTIIEGAGQLVQQGARARVRADLVGALFCEGSDDGDSC